MRALATRTATLASLCFVLAAVGGCKKDESKPGQPTSGDKVVEGAKKMGEGIVEGAKAAWEATKEGAKFVGDKVATGAKVVGEKVVAGAKVVGEKVAEGAKFVAAEATDTWITAKIKARVGVGRLFGVSVDTVAGKVTLTGNVQTAAEKDEIEKFARETSGVKAIVNNLAITAPVPGSAPTPMTAPGTPPSPGATPATPPATPVPAK